MLQETNRPHYYFSFLRRTAMLIGAAAVFLIVLAMRAVILNKKRRTRAAKRWCARGLRLGTRIMPYTVRRHGRLPSGGALLAPNHTSYADVIALGGASECLFVPKQEIGKWPVIGAIVRMTGHILVDRKAGRSMRSTAREIRRRLDDGHKVCVFLEGTTTDGTHLLPLRSSFLQPAIDAGAPIVPVALKWTCTRQGVRLSEDLAFWHPERHHFWKHLARQAGLEGFELDIYYGEPMDPSGWNRKDLAREIEHRLSEQLHLPVQPRNGF